MIKAVFIDIDDTLLDFSGCASISMNGAAHQMGFTLPSDILPVFHSINDKFWQEIECGRLTIEELHEVRWDTIFAHFGITQDGKQFEKLFSRNLFDSAVIINGAKNALEYLASKYRVCVTSNAPSIAQQVNRLTRAGLISHVDDMFISGEIGYSKPRREFFDECFRRITPISIDEVVLIGDSLTADVEGAKRYGIKTCWFNHRNKREDNVESDWIIHSLSEISKIL